MTDEIVLESWDRQAQIIASLAGLVTDANRWVKPSEDGMPLGEQLAHIHEVRQGWLSSFSKAHAEGLGDTYVKVDGKWVPIDDLDEIKRGVHRANRPSLMTILIVGGSLTLAVRSQGRSRPPHVAEAS